jgi:Arc/MetJ family transcription regulator
MRLHISIDDKLVDELDGRVGTRKRSPYIAAALRRALDDERRWEAIADAVGAADDAEHGWDSDPARWVRAQRRADAERVG